MSIWLGINVLLLAAGGAATLWLAFWRGGDASDPPPLALATLFAAITCFGGAGVLALELFGFGPLLAFTAALVFAALSAVLFNLLASVAWQNRERRGERPGWGIGGGGRADRAGATGRGRGEAQPAAIDSSCRFQAGQASLPVGAQVIVTALHNGSGGEDPVEVALLPARGDREFGGRVREGRAVLPLGCASFALFVFKISR
ncbi:MAG: hypothetical protein U0841_03730 [Chloroflexia bacterium]